MSTIQYHGAKGLAQICYDLAGGDYLLAIWFALKAQHLQRKAA
jgi:hypothetical protein